MNFAPAALAASPTQRIFAHARIEASLIMRNGEQLLLALVIPIGLLVLGRFFGGRFGITLSDLAPSVMALAIWSSAFVSVAISTGFDRRQGVLERLVATPLGRTGLLIGKVVAISLITALQLVVIFALALILGWRPTGSPLPHLIAVVTALLAIAAFVCLALALAGTFRAEATLGLANLIYLIGAVGGGLMTPIASYPSAVRVIEQLLPTAALGEALRATSHVVSLWWPPVTAAVWALLSLLLARKAFRWT